MPRDFVPCLYTERAVQGVEDSGMVKRCEVIELFALSDVVTEQPGLIMTRDSHAYCVDATQSQQARVLLVPEGQALLDSAMRKLLFHAFDAAMADLE